jgi:hypothetical protein
MNRTKYPAVPFLLLLALALSACSAMPQPRDPAGSVVSVQKRGGAFVLLRNGEPYFVKGAGGQGHLDTLVQAGGNSIRTWGADHAGRILDEAHARGLTVTLGIWIQHPRHGFDYNDRAAVRAQRERVREIVEAHRDHPALLCWGVGNEVELESDPDLVFPEINNLARLIKRLDPNHPTMAVLAGPWNGKVRSFIKHCPDVDLLGINAYAGIVRVPDELREQGYKGPYLITEFGPRGHWEVENTEWGAPVEPTSTQKAETYRTGYEIAVAASPDRCLGSHVFLWGHKQETTSTWYGIFLPTGESTEILDVMHRIWSGAEPPQRAPQTAPIESPAAKSYVEPGQQFWAAVNASDPDGDPLTYTWTIAAESNDRRSGGDREAAPPVLPELTVAHGPRATLRAPAEPGHYRIFVTITDGTGRAATANIPFAVR